MSTVCAVLQHVLQLSCEHACLVSSGSSRTSEIPPKSLWRSAGERGHFSFDVAAPQHQCPWRRSYGGAATGCTPCVIGDLLKSKHSLLRGKIKFRKEHRGLALNCGCGSRVLLLVSSPSGSQNPQRLKYKNIQKWSLISPPLSAGIREVWDKKNLCSFELLWHGRMCRPKGGFLQSQHAWSDKTDSRSR